jgi:hypothetical protein
MIARARYLLLTSARTRTPLAPLAITVFWVFGTFFYPNNEVGGTWGQTGVTCCALAAWLVGAILAGEPAAQAEMATTAVGGLRGRLGLEGLLVLMVAPLLALPFLGWPLLLHALGQANVFKPPALPGDVAGAALVHVCCGILGGAVAVLFAPPRVTRRATATAAVLASLLVLAGLGTLAGPIAAAQAISDAPRGTVNGSELVACLTCLALAAAAFTAAATWSRRAA